MPQVKTRTARKAAVATRTTRSPDRPLDDVTTLITRIYEYEDIALRCNVDFASSRFKMLTASERDYLRAELVADFIRLSAGNAGGTPVYFETGLLNFCTKITDLELASSEMMGTYLAAAEIARQDKIDEKLPGFEKLMRDTMIVVLQTCNTILAGKARTAVTG